MEGDKNLVGGGKRSSRWITAAFMSLFFVFGVKLLFLGIDYLEENTVSGIAPHYFVTPFALLAVGAAFVAFCWAGPVWILSESYSVLQDVISKRKGGNRGQQQLTR